MPFVAAIVVIVVAVSVISVVVALALISHEKKRRAESFPILRVVKSNRDESPAYDREKPDDPPFHETHGSGSLLRNLPARSDLPAQHPKSPFVDERPAWAKEMQGLPVDNPHPDHLVSGNPNSPLAAERPL